MKTNGNSSNKAISEVLAAIAVGSAHEFTFAGRNFHVHGGNHNHSHAPAPAGQATDAESQAFVKTLSTYLYEFAYSRPFRNEVPESRALDLSPDPELLEALSAANATRDRWEHGWSVGQIMHGGQILARKGNLTRNVWPGQFLSKDGPAAVLRQGAEVSIFYARESRSLQDGFYYAFGEAVEETKQGFGLVRLYWNVRLDGAAKLIGLLTARFNRFQVPFRLKCVTSRSQFERTDKAVVYLAKRFFPIAADLMLEVHREIADQLEDDVPLFSKKLAKGLGVAEDPGTGESFGQSRCHPLAQSVWNCYQQGEHSPKARLREFGRLLKENKIDPKHLHLNVGSLDWYQLPIETSAQTAAEIAAEPVKIA